MPHDTIIYAILAMLIYIFVPQFFGYAAIALVLWLGFPIMRIVWQTTRDIREIPESEDGEGEEADVEQSREHFTVLDNMGECDFDDVGIYSEAAQGYVAWFQFVYGNVTSTSEAIEVISDYSANNYGNNIYRQVEEMTQ